MSFLSAYANPRKDLIVLPSRRVHHGGAAIRNQTTVVALLEEFPQEVRDCSEHKVASLKMQSDICNLLIKKI